MISKKLIPNYILLAIWLGIGATILLVSFIRQHERAIELISPVGAYYEVEIPTPTRIQSQREMMENYLCYQKDWDCEVAKKIIQCESGWNPKALNGNKNGSVDIGLMQINTIHKADKERLFDYEYNIDMGYKIYQRSGNSFHPWVCSRKV